MAIKTKKLVKKAVSKAVKKDVVKTEESALDALIMETIRKDKAIRRAIKELGIKAPISERRWRELVGAPRINKSGTV